MTYWCIYRITNNINGKTYIGQHKYTDEDNPMYKYAGSGKLLHYAYKKYGIENFSTEVLYKRIQYKETADSMEIWAIEKERKSNPSGCYNILKGGQGNRAYQPSEDSKKQISETLKQYYSNHINLFTGKHHTEATKKKISKANKGRHHSNQAKKNISKKMKDKNTWIKGRKHFNNGTISVMAFECPEGFVPGRLPRRKSCK